MPPITTTTTTLEEFRALYRDWLREAFGEDYYTFEVGCFAESTTRQTRENREPASLPASDAGFGGYRHQTDRAASGLAAPTRLVCVGFA